MILKYDLIRPGLKRNDLENDELNNYRPASNVPFLFKVIEKLVSARLASTWI